MTPMTTEVLIIGGGPGGYMAALRCAAHGLRTTVVERGHVGGTCLNVGCIPSKALIHAAERYAGLTEPDLEAIGLRCERPSVDLATTMGWKDGIVDQLRNGVSSLLTAAGVTCIQGTATIVDGKTVDVLTADGTVTIGTTHLVLATGSRPVELSALPFGGPVISSTEALTLQHVPPSMVVVGAGYIGLELGTAFAKLGSKVTVVEATPRILPQYDPVLTRPVLQQLTRLGVDLMLGCTAEGLKGDALVVRDSDDQVHELPGTTVLVAVGRTPATSGFGLEGLDLTMSGRFVRVDERCQTSMDRVYAIGDMTGEPMLAHRAMAQGTLVADVIAGEPRVWDNRAMPAVCFTDPEIFSVGLSAREAREAGIPTVVGTFPFRANGRALTLDRTDGVIQLVAREDDRVVLGVHGVGLGVSELAASGCLALEMGATLEDIALTVHAHPTLSEALQEAALLGLATVRGTVFS